jgi:hypothetical protein
VWRTRDEIKSRSRVNFVGQSLSGRGMRWSENIGPSNYLVKPNFILS